MNTKDRPFIVPFDGHFSVAGSQSAPPENVPGKKVLEKELSKCVAQISELQRN